MQVIVSVRAGHASEVQPKAEAFAFSEYVELHTRDDYDSAPNVTTLTRSEAVALFAKLGMLLMA